MPGLRSSWNRVSRARRTLLIAAAGRVALASPLAALAQPAAKAARVGFLGGDAGSARLRQAFLLGLRDLGLVDGRSVIVEWRFADGSYARLPGLAADLVRLKVDVIVAVSTLCVQAARAATTTIPIVMVGVPDPIGEGFATSLSRPGGNITGLSNIVTEVSSKHLELMLAAVPKLAQIGVLINPDNPSDALILEQIQGAAYTRRVKVLPVEAATAGQIEAAFATLAGARMQALIVASDAHFDVQRDLIIRLANGTRLPTIFSSREMTEAGGLMSYGQDLAEHYRRAATYVDRILKGAKPGSLPIEQPTVLEFVINRRTATALGLAIPPVLELRADRVID